MDNLIESSTKAKEAISKGLDYMIELHRTNASLNCALVSQNCKLIELIAKKDEELKFLRVKLAKLQGQGTMTVAIAEKLKTLSGVIAAFSSVKVGEDFTPNDSIILFVKEHISTEHSNLIVKILQLEEETGLSIRVTAAQGRDLNTLTNLKQL